MATPQELGVLIREARLAKGMSLGQLASAVGRSSSSVRRWERGEVAPAAPVLPKLAAILEIDIVRRGDDGYSTLGDSQESTEDESSQDEGNGRVVTVEQPVVAGVDPVPIRDEAPSQPVSATGGGIFADFWGVLTRGGRGWMGWIRGLLTAGALVAMLFVMIWAMGELFDAFGAVLDSFDVGSNGDSG